MTIVAFLVGLFLGSAGTLFAVALCSAAAAGDRGMEHRP